MAGEGKNVSVWLPATVADRLADMAAGRDTTRSKLGAALLERALTAEADKPISRTPDRSKLPVRDQPLEALLWATQRTVRCGSIDAGATFVEDRSGATAAVDQVLIDTGTGEGYWAPRLDQLDRPRAVRAFQETVADMAIFGMLIDEKTTSSSEGFQVARSHKKFKSRWARVCRAMDVDTSGEGADWVPTGVGAVMHERARALGKVAPLFPRIQLPTSMWDWPLEGADPTAYRIAEPTSDTASKVTASTAQTNKARFDAEIFGARVLLSRSVDADSAIPIIPFVRDKIVKAFAIAVEKAILDGDTDGSHQDSDVTGTADARTAWDGLRKRGLSLTGVDASNGQLTSARISTQWARMGRWGLVPNDVAIIVPPTAYYSLLSDTNVLTVDKFGPDATILHGQIGSIFGIPIIISEHMRTNLNASGVYDGITTNRTSAVIVNTAQWALGIRQPLAIEVDDSPYRESYQRVVLGFERSDFQYIGESTSDPNTGLIYNLTAA